ncbi:uncharacterized protein LOC119596287 isoform X2 [Penaeus monodon]|uniref:uncharacterized protein LOC119596287 isoform X2 n=1 Tax=Penaeus monodon TaxID=6687 RepID=UPI0018A73965|nr:uncharacterized protein LOC119596287 isoform X2 [Penaeus monodon]
MGSILPKLYLILCVWGAILLFILRHFSSEIRYIQKRIGLQGRSVINETKIDYEVLSDPVPISIPQTVFVIEKKEEKEKVPTSCACKAIPLRRSAFYQGQLSMMLSWKNQTSLQVLAKQHPNFPHSLLVNTSENFCELMPPPHNIAWEETYYQTVTVSNTTTYLLYSAVFDNRPLTDIRPCIRILAFTTAKKPTFPWCYIWFNTTGPPAISEVIRSEFIDWQPKSDKHHMFFLLTCRIPDGVAHMMPLAVSVVRAPCEKAQTLLQVNGAMQRGSSAKFEGGDANKAVNGTPLWNVAVCGPALFYYHDDISIRLVEWLELLRAQGFAKVFLLQTTVHPNIEKVLQYYEQEGFVGITQFSYPVPYANEPTLRRLWVLMERVKLFAMENIYFTDCLLRHMHEYRFIAHFDPDEMPMLPNHDSFPSWLHDHVRSSLPEIIGPKSDQCLADRTRDAVLSACLNT